jgi:hypothetical protein
VNFQVVKLRRAIGKQSEKVSGSRSIPGPTFIPSPMQTLGEVADELVLKSQRHAMRSLGFDRLAMADQDELAGPTYQRATRKTPAFD